MTSRFGHVMAMTALFLAAGFLTRWWWALAAPAIVYGFFVGHGRGRCFYLDVALAAAVAWLIPAAIHDAAVGWRISGRIAGLMGLRGGFFAYLLMACLGALTAILGSSVGAALRAALPPRWVWSSAGKPTD